MIKFCTTKRVSCLILLLLFCYPKGAVSKTNFADLNKNSFYKKDKVKQYLSIGGGYKSDYNSKEHEVLAAYKYKSSKFIHEFDFLHEVTEGSTTRKPMRKTEELYDFEASSRMLLFQSKNYLNLYNRIQYDELSKFYYDVSSAIGLGRLFKNGLIESSINFGYNDVKNFNSEIIVIGILKGKINLSKNLKLSTRGLLTRNEGEYEEEIKNVLSYKIKKNVFLELIHRYERNRYIKTTKKYGTARINRVKRDAYIRLKYNF